jgi:hypothetical protein
MELFRRLAVKRSNCDGDGDGQKLRNGGMDRNLMQISEGKKNS